MSGILSSFEDQSDTLILLVVIGAFEGSFIGAMANVMPFQVVIACAMMTSLLVWRSKRTSFYVAVIMAAAVSAGGFGALAGIIPWGFALFFGMQIVVYLWRTGASSFGGSLPSLIAIPFYIFISVAIFYNNANPDFCFTFPSPGAHIDVCQDPSAWVNGFPTIWAGCVSTCSVTTFSLFGSSIFSNFINSAATGDYIGMITGLFVGPQSSVGGIFSIITTLITLTAGVILLLIGLGLGFTGGALTATIGITVNEAGTRMAQSMGIGLVLWSLVFAGFNAWFTAFGTGFTFGGVFSTTLIVFFATMVFYGFYIQGKTVTGSTG